MLSTNVTDLRNALQKYLAYVKQGEHIIVTAYGKPIARILPLKDAQEEAKDTLKQLRKRCKIGDVISPIKEEWDVDS